MTAENPKTLQFAFDFQPAVSVEAQAVCTKVLQHSEQVQYDEYDGDNDQSMDPIASLREV
jgi:hypothetical protein